MDLLALLAHRKSEIIDKWHDAVLKTYAPDTATFYKAQKNTFENPVGSMTLQGVIAVFDALLGQSDPSSVRSSLDPLIRIRAVQNFRPSQATSFFLSLKTIIRQMFKRELANIKRLEELSVIETKIDTMMLLSFDIYMECREKIYDLKANVEKEKVYKAFSRAGLVMDLPDDTPDLITH